MRTGFNPGRFLLVGLALYVAATLHRGIWLNTVCKTMLFMVGLAKPCAFDGWVSKTITMDVVEAPPVGGERSNSLTQVEHANIDNMSELAVLKFPLLGTEHFQLQLYMRDVVVQLPEDSRDFLE